MARPASVSVCSASHMSSAVVLLDMASRSSEKPNSPPTSRRTSRASPG